MIPQQSKNNNPFSFPKRQKARSRSSGKSGSTACLGESNHPAGRPLHLVLPGRHGNLLEHVRHIVRRCPQHILIEVGVNVRGCLVIAVFHDLHGFQRVNPSSVKHGHEVVAKVVRSQRCLPRVQRIVGPVRLGALLIISKKTFVSFFRNRKPYISGEF